MINNVILLCSEITKGMKSYGPKAFVPVGNKYKQKPLVIKQIDNIIQRYTKNTDIYIVIGFEHDKFLKILDPKQFQTIERILKRSRNSSQLTCLFTKITVK